MAYQFKKKLDLPWTPFNRYFKHRWGAPQMSLFRLTLSDPIMMINDNNKLHRLSQTPITITISLIHVIYHPDHAIQIC